MKTFRLFPLLLALILLLSAFSPAALALEDPSVDAQAAILVNLDSGEVLYRLNDGDQRSPASLTKVMTALLAIEAAEEGRVSLDDIVTAGNDCQQGLDTDSSNASIVSGEQMPLRDYLYCAMVASANEACNVIASFIGGSISGFVDLMNQRAEELGCTGTHFADPNGLSNENHYSTAYDLYLITREAIKHPDFMAICNAAEYTIPATNANEERHLSNSNALLSETGYYGPGYLYSGAAGVKTGYTRQAGYCLISTAEKDNIHVLAIVLGCDGPLLTEGARVCSFVETADLYNWVFDNFAYQQVLTAADPVEKVNIDKAEGDGVAILRPASDIYLLLPNDVDPESREVRIELFEDKLVAPIQAGEVLGQAVISLGGKEYGPVDLVTNAEIGVSKGLYMRERVLSVLDRGWVKTVIVILLVVLVLYIALVLRYRALRRRHLREKRRAEKRRRQLQEQRAREAKQRAPQGYTTVDPAERDEPLDLSRYFDEIEQDKRG